MNARLETEQQIVERFGRMADASRRMLEAARQKDWDAVCAVEKECTALIAELSQMGDLAPTDPELRRQKVDLIKRVLAADAEIRALTQPWLEKLDAVLRGTDPAARLDRGRGPDSLPG